MSAIGHPLAPSVRSATHDHAAASAVTERTSHVQRVDISALCLICSRWLAYGAPADTCHGRASLGWSTHQRWSEQNRTCCYVNNSIIIHGDPVSDILLFQVANSVTFSLSCTRWHAAALCYIVTAERRALTYSRHETVDLVGSLLCYRCSRDLASSLWLMCSTFVDSRLLAVSGSTELRHTVLGWSASTC